MNFFPPKRHVGSTLPPPGVNGHAKGALEPGAIANAGDAPQASGQAPATSFLPVRGGASGGPKPGSPIAQAAVIPEKSRPSGPAAQTLAIQGAQQAGSPKHRGSRQAPVAAPAAADHAPAAGDGIKRIIEDALDKWLSAYETRQDARLHKLFSQHQSTIDSSLSEFLGKMASEASLEDATEAKIDLLVENVEGYQAAIRGFWDQNQRIVADAIDEKILPLVSQIDRNESAQRDSLLHIQALLDSYQEDRMVKTTTYKTEETRPSAVSAISDHDDEEEEPPAAVTPGFNILPRASRKSLAKAAQRSVRAAHILEGVSALVIIANVVYMIHSADVVASELQFQTGVSHTVIEACFLSFYISELLLRVAMQRLRYIFGPDWKWNGMDVLLVIFGIIDIATQSGSGTMALKTIRLLRLSKFFRIRRVLEMSKQMRLVFTCLSQSLELFVGYVFTVAAYLMMVSLYLVPAVADYRIEHRESISDTQTAFFNDCFGSVLKSMNTVFQTWSSGRPWVEVYDALDPLGSLPARIYLVSLVIYIILVGNVFASVFVRNVLLASTDAMQDKKHKQALKDSKDVDKLLAYSQKRLGPSDTISYKHFLALMLQSDFRRVFEQRGVGLEDAKMVFIKLIKVPAEPLPHVWETHNVSREKFFLACLRVKEDVSSVDLLPSSISFERFVREQKDRLAAQKTALDELGAMVKVMTRHSQG